jgi:hypothetical protein
VYFLYKIYVYKVILLSEDNIFQKYFACQKFYLILRRLFEVGAMFCFDFFLNEIVAMRALTLTLTDFYTYTHTN